MALRADAWGPGLWCGASAGVGRGVCQSPCRVQWAGWVSHPCGLQSCDRPASLL